jgi:hypothetical protein
MVMPLFSGYKSRWHLIFQNCFELMFWPRASRPSDFSYKHDAKHNSTFMVAKAWDDTDDDAFLQELSEVLNEAKPGLLYPTSRNIMYLSHSGHYSCRARISSPLASLPFSAP